MAAPTGLARRLSQILITASGSTSRTARPCSAHKYASKRRTLQGTLRASISMLVLYSTTRPTPARRSTHRPRQSVSLSRIYSCAYYHCALNRQGRAAFHLGVEIRIFNLNLTKSCDSLSLFQCWRRTIKIKTWKRISLIVQRYNRTIS